MGSSPTTLHDFVLDLLSNPTALADFQADAEGALADAGLSDISALDVQEVLPLVLDYVPAGSLPALDGALLNDLPLDATDATGAIGQLQAVAQQLSLPGVPGTSDVNLAAAGALSADANGYEVFGGFSGWGSTDSADSFAGTVSGDFSSVGDVTSTLDATSTTATGTVSDLAGTATGSLDGALAGEATGTLPATDGLTSPVFGTVDTLTGVVDGVTGGLAGHVPTELAGTLDPAHLGKTLNADGLAALPERDLTPETVVDTAEDTAGRLSNGTGVSNVTDHVGAIDVPVLGFGLNDVPLIGGGHDISDTLF